MLMTAAQLLLTGRARPRPQGPQDGVQHFRMHPLLRCLAEDGLKAYQRWSVSGGSNVIAPVHDEVGG